MLLNQRSHSSIASPPSITSTTSFNGVTFVNRTSATMKNQWYHTVNIPRMHQFACKIQRPFMASPNASPLKKIEYNLSENYILDVKAVLFYSSKKKENYILGLREQIGNL
jgi:hypothetical protein